MKKINKIKKGVVKVFDFNKECECVVSDSYEKVVAGNKFELCVVCDCIKNKNDDVEIDEVIVGNVLAPGCNAAGIRMAMYMAGIPDATSCQGINRMCSSGL